MIQVFNKIISGDDADSFLSLTREEKKQWILNNTNQSKDVLIEEFLNSKVIELKGCLSCGEMNNQIVRHGDNISERNAIENADSSNEGLVRESSNGNRTERPKKIKRRKNK